VALLHKSNMTRRRFFDANSVDANGVRESESHRVVEHAHAHADRDFGCLRTNASRPKAIAGKRLEAVHQVFYERASLLAAAFLPFRAPGFRDRVGSLVAPACAGRILPAGQAASRGDLAFSSLPMLNSTRCIAASS
jgi:hypothetical protein